MRSGSETETITAGDVAFTATLSAQICGACGESLISARDSNRLELVAAQWLTDNGTRTAKSFKFMRKALGLRAANLADLLGVSPYTLGRWESGERDVDKKAFALLGQLVVGHLEGRGNARARLEALGREPKRPRKPVRIELPN